jgi:hypothetical protein
MKLFNAIKNNELTTGQFIAVTISVFALSGLANYLFF